MTIAYKVVRPHIDGVFKSAINQNKLRVRRALNAENQRVPSRLYKVGHTTKAYPKSLGLFCFEKYKDAEYFADGGLSNKILKVEGLGKPYRPRNLDFSWSCPMLDFGGRGFVPPKGSVCYPQVKVLKLLPYS